MSLLETYDKNKKKHLLHEVTAATAVGGFTGRGGQLVDQLFAGAFHPEFGNLKKVLDQQIDDNIVKRMYTDDVTPFADQDFIDLEWDYEYDENEEIDNSKFKTTGDKMQLVDIDIKYDKIIDNTEKNKNFVSDTNDWKYIYNNKQ
tara:strand:+ start:54 stop:488 length:435 start_codon:yes stop_codon:yes gene_type:complete